MGSDAPKWADKGSQLQMQLLANNEPSKLQSEVLEALPSLKIHEPQLRWVSPLEKDGFREYKDADFLDAIGLSALGPLLKQFWPDRGPHWDGLAIVERRSGDFGVLLVEAKAHTEEIKSGGMRASANASKQQIQRAIHATQNWLTVPEKTRGNWYGENYQTANRIAHLYWLRQVAGIDAWLLHLLVVEDRTYIPTPREAWSSAIAEVENELGLNEGFVPHYGHAFINGLPKP